MEKETWWKSNGTLTSLIISTTLILLTFAAAWGELRAEIRAVDVRLTTTEQSIRDHHEDYARHVDDNFKTDIRTQLAEIRRLISAHMEASSTRRDGGSK